MKEICMHEKAIRTVVRNNRAGSESQAKVRTFIGRGGLLSKNVGVFEGIPAKRTQGRTDSFANE
jgi:hypothetical protein